MSERKVLNKYYPPDFDPAKIPKLNLPRNRQYTIRIMAPFNMRCNTCGEYIYKGKKFNSRKETVENETYLGLYIFRFYIKCPRCVAEIAFKTDPEKTDYSLEAGATRNFEPGRTAEEMAKRQIAEKEEEERNNPMKVLENRTKQSRNEMDMIETLEELRDLNSRHAKVDHDHIIKLHQAYEEQLQLLQDEEDERVVTSAFGKSSVIKRLPDEQEENPTRNKILKTEKATDLLVSPQISTEDTKIEKKKVWNRSVGVCKSSLFGLVKKKTPSKSGVQTTPVKTDSTPPADRHQEPSVETRPAENNCQTVSELNTSQSVNSVSTSHSTAAPSALGLLGNYSDSSEQSDS